MPRPSTPVGYVAGIVFLPVNVVRNLLELIQQQIEPDCPGAATEMQLIGGGPSGAIILIGAASRLRGPLSASNFGYQLTPGVARLYRSTYPGNSVPIGQIQALCVTSGAYLNVEVQV